MIATAESEKVVDKAEDPEWLVEKKIPLDRLYYLRKQLETPLTVLTSYFCDTKALFDKAHAEVWRQLAKNARITDFMPQRKGIVEGRRRSIARSDQEKRSRRSERLGVALRRRLRQRRKNLPNHARRRKSSPNPR